jgi:pilus assembly protein Flp/PilA
MRKSTLQKEDQKMFKKFFAMVKDEKGQALAEYGLILALIAVVAVGSLIVLGGGIDTTLQAINAQL